MELIVGQKSVNILKTNRAKYLHVESCKMQKTAMYYICPVQSGCGVDWERVSHLCSNSRVVRPIVR